MDEEVETERSRQEPRKCYERVDGEWREVGRQIVEKRFLAEWRQRNAETERLERAAQKQLEEERKEATRLRRKALEERTITVLSSDLSNAELARLLKTESGTIKGIRQRAASERTPLTKPHPPS